ncbi:MarR family transcriptional regulator [Deinococcus sonorensis]|uniref:MarR family transcriptional regulator n=2 Tax=Deinococcus sonorensis TaxID=309891 RepID=A0AAU7UDX1_9DEIO
MSRPGEQGSTDTFLERLQADWGRVLPELDSQPMLLPILVARLHQALSRRVEDTYRASGLNAANWDLLVTLRRSAPPEGLTLSELAGLTAVAGPTMTNRVDRLQQKGLVERLADPQDGRSWRIRLTAHAEALLDRLLPAHVHNEARLLSGLSAAERAQFERLIRRLLRDLEVPPG